MWCRDRFSPTAQRVMRAGHAERDRAGHRYFGDEHVLLGLLNVPDTAAFGLLHRHGLRLEEVRAEITGIITAAGSADSVAGLRQFGIDLNAVQARIEATFGAIQVLEASHRVARRPWWRGRSRPVPAFRPPFLIKRAMETAEHRARAQHSTMVEPEHLLYGIVSDARKPLGTNLRHRGRAQLFAQIGLHDGGPHPISQLLHAHRIGPNELLRELDQVSAR